MSWSDIFLLCFALGALWSFASLLLGGLHLGHGHGGAHGAIGHGHGHLHAHTGGHAYSGAPGHGSAHRNGSNLQGGSPGSSLGSLLGSLANPSSAAVFLTWFGGVGYLLTRHTGLLFWLDIAIAAGFGLAGAWLLAAFLRFLESREKPLDPADYDMIGVLGRVSSPIRAGGVGEVLYVRDGARKPVCASSDDGRPITRGEEVIVTRYEKGVAYVRTWNAMVPDEALLPEAPSLRSKENESEQ